MSSSTPSSSQSPATTPSSNNQHPIAQQLAALQTMKQKSASPSPPISPSSVPPQKTRFNWTGFQGKTAWDWLDFLVKLLGALAIPLVVVLASNTLNTQQQQTAETQHQNELTIADDQQKETTLKAYLDDMTSLLLNNKLHESKPTDEVRNVASVKTLTTVRRLDGTRKNILLQFLYEAKLINSPKPIVDISGANLSGADLNGTNLSGADLREVDLREAYLGKIYRVGTSVRAFYRVGDLSAAKLADADLSRADLSGADLSGAVVIGVNLTGANLSGAVVSGAVVIGAYLTGANLIGAYLNGADLSSADLNGANLSSANLSSADLRSADLSSADLNGADLNGADLTGATVTNTQLATAYSLEGAILPNGSIHP